MRVIDQADAGRDDIFRNGDLTGDGLVAGLGVVALMGDRADDVNATLTDQVRGALFGQYSAQVMGNACLLYTSDAADE